MELACTRCLAEFFKVYGETPGYDMHQYRALTVLDGQAVCWNHLQEVLQKTQEAFEAPEPTQYRYKYRPGFTYLGEPHSPWRTLGHAIDFGEDMSQIDRMEFRGIRSG